MLSDLHVDATKLDVCKKSSLQSMLSSWPEGKGRNGTDTTVTEHISL